MARYVNKTCEKCGYKAHRLFDLDYMSRYGICSDCVVDYLMNEEDPDECANIVDDLTVSEESEEI